MEDKIALVREIPFLAVLLLFLSASSAAAQDHACAVPVVDVPISDVDGALRACVDRIPSERDASIAAINRLLVFGSCGDSQSQAQAEAAAQRLNCAGAQLDSATAIALVAKEIAPKNSNEELARLKCAASESMFREAAKLGSIKAQEHFFLAFRYGYADGCTAVPDLTRAAEHMLLGASLGSSWLQTELAMTLLNERSPGAHGDVDGLHGHFYSRIPSVAKLPGATDGEILRLFTAGARAHESMAKRNLIELYATGTVVEKRLDLAIAWAAIDAMRDEPGSDYAAKFESLYAQADEQTRQSACGTLRAWSLDDINFHVLSDDLKNDFVRKCFVSSAVIEKHSCLSGPSVEYLLDAIEPLLKKLPMCR